MNNNDFAEKIKNSNFAKNYLPEIKKVPEFSEAAHTNIIPKVEDIYNFNCEINWEKPLPLNVFELKPFPVESYPKEISDFVKALSVSTQTATEMSSIAVLGALAICNQGKFVVRIKPEYCEPLSLYTVAVAEPGERKSAVIRAVSLPIRNFELEYNKLHKSEIIQSVATYRSLQKRVEETEKNFAKGKVLLDEVLKSAENFENFKQKLPLKLLVDNATTEKLVDLMQEQGGKIAITSAEGGIFKNFGSDYKKDVDIDPYLKAHDGDSISFDRINRSANYIENPALSMLISTQPQRIQKFIENNEYKNCGLVARFLIVFCKSNQGYRNVDPQEIPQEVFENYQNLSQRMLSRNCNNKEIFRSKNAKAEYLNFQQTIEEKLIDKWHNMRDFASKIPGTMLRIAGLLHCVEFEKPQEINISEETIKKAIDITMYIANSTEQLYSNSNKHSEVNNAKYLLNRIRNLEKLEFDKQELYQICKGRLPKSCDINSCLSFLEKCNYLKIITSQTGGRPKQKVILNPIKNNT